MSGGALPRHTVAPPLSGTFRCSSVSGWSWNRQTGVRYTHECIARCAASQSTLITTVAKFRQRSTSERRRGEEEHGARKDSDRCLVSDQSLSMAFRIGSEYSSRLLDSQMVECRVNWKTVASNRWLSTYRMRGPDQMRSNASWSWIAVH